jgi:hypothetical protein
MFREFGIKLSGMETLFAVVGASLLVSAILTMIGIVRDVFPLLSPEDQISLRDHWFGASFRVWRSRDRAIGRAWNEHVRSFKRSRKRALFSLLLIAGILLIVSYSILIASGLATR